MATSPHQVKLREQQFTIESLHSELEAARADLRATLSTSRNAETSLSSHQDALRKTYDAALESERRRRRELESALLWVVPNDDSTRS
jgi:hypothetical protein